MQAIDFVIGADQDITDFVDASQVLDVRFVTATDIVDSADTDTQVGGVAVITDDAVVADGIWHLLFQSDRDQGSLPSGFSWSEGQIVQDAN